MAEREAIQPQVTTLGTFPAGEIVAVDVSAEDYMAQYAAEGYEWVRGAVIKMAAATIRHYLLVRYMTSIFETYFKLNPIGQALGEPIVMHLKTVGTRREPDLQVILNTNTGSLTTTEFTGAADICIEVVSPESVKRDYGDKFDEYQKGGVREYWIIDPTRDDALFYRLNENDVYKRHDADDAGYYVTPLLPKLTLHVPTLWAEPLPDIMQVVEMVKAMFATD